MLRSIPTPSSSVLEFGPVTIHFYALCIIAGIALAIWLGDRRLVQMNQAYKGIVGEVAIVAVPSGIIGGRIYHVLTSPTPYFGDGGQPLDAFKIWQGGLGIWGAISLGAIGAWLRYRTLTVEKPSFAHFLDALAPGLLLAQAIGRFGNWFNGELFGRPLDAPWALEIPLSLRPVGYRQFETFHPTFLYEAIWCALLALILMQIRTKPGQLFSLYVVGYCIGRFGVEYLRIDQAQVFAGMRLNNWVALVVGALAIASFIRIGRRAH